MGQAGSTTQNAKPAPAAWKDPPKPGLRRLASPGGAALAAMLVFAMLLGARPLTSADLGYHLDYGQSFLRTGVPVDHNDYIFLNNKEAARELKPSDIGPGCWVDEQGNYRFPNANWLFQALLAGVYNAGGFGALWIMQMVLLAGLLAAGVVGMRRLGLGPLAIATGVSLIAMVAYERFVLRPEMFSMVLLATQLAILLPVYRRGLTEAQTSDWPGAQREHGHAQRQGLTMPPSEPSARVIAAVVLVQLLMVNLHSYFLLGLVVTGAMLADALARLAWSRMRKAAGPLPSATARRLGLLLGLQVAVCFANPWTWRIVLLPFQTVLFLNAHGVGSQMTHLGHPWQMIGEFWRPFESAFALYKASWAYEAMLVLAALAALAAIVRRRGAYAIILAAFAAVSLSMRRNIAPAAVMMTPVAIAAIVDFFRGVKWRPIQARWFRMGLAALLTAGAIVGCYSVVTQRFYYSEHTSARFGYGVSRIDVPVGAGEFIRRNLPADARVWTDFNSSSNMRFLGLCQVPVLTNTWAYPPGVLAKLQATSLAPAGIVGDLQRLGVQAAAIRIDDGFAMRFSDDSVPRQLVRKWKMVYFDGVYAVFVPRDGNLAHLPEVTCLQDGLLERAAKLDPVKAAGLHEAGESMYILGDLDSAVTAFEAALKYDDTHFRTWNMLGLCLGRRVEAQLATAEPDYVAVRRDLKAARRAFDAALRTCDDPSFVKAIELNISSANVRMSQLGIGASE